jgi:hypothetical protein
MNPMTVRSTDDGNPQRSMISMSTPGAENPVQDVISR